MSLLCASAACMAACRPECYVRLGRVEASCVLRAHYSMYPECRMGQVRYLNSPAVLMQSYTRWVGQLTASWAACCCIYAPLHPGHISRGPARGAICLAARWHPQPCVSSSLARAGSGSDKVCTQLVRLPGRWGQGKKASPDPRPCSATACLPRAAPRPYGMPQNTQFYCMRCGARET